MKQNKTWEVARVRDGKAIDGIILTTYTSKEYFPMDIDVAERLMTRLIEITS
jgi:hypothetical protein